MLHSRHQSQPGNESDQFSWSPRGELTPTLYNCRRQTVQYSEHQRFKCTRDTNKK